MIKAAGEMIEMISECSWKILMMNEGNNPSFSEQIDILGSVVTILVRFETKGFE